MTPAERVQQTEVLLKKMSIPDLIAYRSCPVAFLDNFEQAMLKKYGILAVA
jgi:hypothetical protein